MDGHCDDYEFEWVEDPAQPLAHVPMLQVHGEGYITRKDGTIVPFILSGEST